MRWCLEGSGSLIFDPTTRSSVVPMEICSLGRVYGVSSP